MIAAILRKIAMLFIAILRQIVRLARDDQPPTFKGLMQELLKLFCHCVLTYCKGAALNW